MYQNVKVRMITTRCYYLLPSDGFGGPIRVEYIRSGNVVTGVRYIILSATEHDAGLYACTATNKFGSDTKHLTLNVVLGGGSASGKTKWYAVTTHGWVVGGGLPYKK